VQVARIMKILLNEELWLKTSLVTLAKVFKLNHNNTTLLNSLKYLQGDVVAQVKNNTLPHTTRSFCTQLCWLHLLMLWVFLPLRT
jgi:hypothetical protein